MSHTDLFGTWTLISHQFVTLDGQGRRDMFGPDPLGSLTLTPDMRLSALITTSTRKATDSEADLFKTLLAYSGPFRVEGDQIITTVQVAWVPAWLGTEQSRSFAITNGLLTLKTAEMAHPMFAGRPACGILTWQRA